tara:strand:- start:435 stop:641 length:207 start_codon:yes stop_codon:yes gene_type:complete
MTGVSGGGVGGPTYQDVLAQTPPEQIAAVYPPSPSDALKLSLPEESNVPAPVLPAEDQPYDAFGGPVK